MSSEANEADQAEQSIAITDDDGYDDQVDVEVEADDYDVAEQARTVADVDLDDDRPRD
jgi:hypothetical protein